MKPFVVAGAGRSGTLYISQVLTELGAPCAHEKAFAPSTTEWPDSFESGEASWHVVPFLDARSQETVIIHLVRNPQKVVASLYGREFFRYGPRTLRIVRPWRRVTGRPKIARGRQHCVDFIRRTTPSVLEPDNELDRCIRYWVELNSIVEESDPSLIRLRIEDLGAESLGLIFRRLDLPPPTTADTERALAAASAQAHESSPSQSARAEFVTESRLNSSAEWARALELARNYGY